MYQKLGIGGFHIDRGAGQQDKVRFSLEKKFPYYVDHAADKGFLFLTGQNAESVKGKSDLLIRPHSLADPQTIAALKAHLEKNITATRNGFVLAYSFDDEISLAKLISPADVDIHPLSLARFRIWLKQRYGAIEKLNQQWDSRFKNFDDVMPQGFEQIRQKIKELPMSQWNLSPWMDFRQFMDSQFSAVLSELVQYSNQLAPDIPAGFVGGQSPNTWGGYDYARLSRAVQWMEAYNIHETNEILRSFWNEERRPRMQTFFSTKNPKADSWFLWYYLLHGNQAVIAWPEGWFHPSPQPLPEAERGAYIAPYILADAAVFKEIQGKISEPFVDSKTKFMADPIGIYYSHPGIQASWAMDALLHGKTWSKLFSSTDNEHQSMGILRRSWCKLLEDSGFQYEFISYLDVMEKEPDLSRRFKVIILPKMLCISDKEARVLKKFVGQGGTLIADQFCGIFDEHGKAREKRASDKLNITLTELPSAYLEKRYSSYGEEFRTNIARILKNAGLTPRVKIYEAGKSPNMIEALFWKNESRVYLGIVKNPVRIEGLDGAETDIRLEFQEPVELKNLRTERSLGRKKVFEDRFKPYEANVYEVIGYSYTYPHF